MVNDELGGLQDKYIELLTYHGDTYKYYERAMQCDEPNEQLVTNTKRTLAYLEFQMGKIRDQYRQALIDHALEAYLANNPGPDDKPSCLLSPPSESGSSQSDEHTISSPELDVASANGSSGTSVLTDIEKTPEELEKEELLASFGLIENDKYKVMCKEREELREKLQKDNRRRRNVNPKYCTEAQKKREQDRERRKKAQIQKKKSKKTLPNYGPDCKTIVFDNRIRMNDAFQQIISIPLETYCCLICREAMNRRNRKTVLGCTDCQTLYHLACLTAPNVNIEPKCIICATIALRGSTGERLETSQNYQECHSLSYKILQQVQQKSQLSRSNKTIQRLAEDRKRRY